MNKVLKHLKNNAAIYLVLLACLVVLLIVVLHLLVFYLKLFS